MKKPLILLLADAPLNTGDNKRAERLLKKSGIDYITLQTDGHEPCLVCGTMLYQGLREIKLYLG